MTFGSLFAGIGGFDLGLERAGMTPKWQVEIDPFCRRVLAKHWPHVRRYEDVRTVHARRVCPDGLCDRCLEDVDLLCGGWPCQPVSSASHANRAGTASPYWLWPEMRRIVSELQPAWFCGENVTALDRSELDAVVADLESLGYEVAPPLEVPACAFGLDHYRPRLWLLGHTNRDGQSRLPVHAEVARMPRRADDAGIVGDANGLSGRLDRRRMAALGNAVVPQITEWIGRRILEAHS